MEEIAYVLFYHDTRRRSAVAVSLDKWFIVRHAVLKFTLDSEGERDLNEHDRVNFEYGAFLEIESVRFV